MAYEDFKSLKGVKVGSVLGEVPFDSDGASAFMYAKTISIFVPMTLSGDGPQVKPTGSWKFRIRENSGRGSDGQLSGTILFEQAVKLTLTIHAMNYMGMDFVSWQGGKAQVQTSICNGQSCAVIEEFETATDEQKAAYLESGAWKYFDLSPTRGGTAESYYNLERGDVRKDYPDYGVAIGGLHFFGKWVSEAYACQIPDGAVVEILYDQWQFGRLREATYQLSRKRGGGKSPFLVHPAGFMMSATRNNQDLVIESYNGGVGNKERVATIKEASPVSIARHHHNGDIYVGLRDSSGMRLAMSNNDGASFTLMANAFDSSYTPHDFELLFGATAGAVATKDGKIYFRISYDGGTNWGEEVEVGKPVNGMKNLSLRQHLVNGKGVLTITDSVSCRFDSTSDGATWAEIT